MLRLALSCRSNVLQICVTDVLWFQLPGEGKGMAAPQLYVTDPLYSNSLPRSNDYKAFIM